MKCTSNDQGFRVRNDAITAWHSTGFTNLENIELRLDDTAGIYQPSRLFELTTSLRRITIPPIGTIKNSTCYTSIKFSSARVKR